MSDHNGLNDIYECGSCGFKGNGYECIRHMRDIHPELVKPWEKAIINKYKTMVDVPGGP